MTGTASLATDPGYSFLATPEARAACLNGACIAAIRVSKPDYTLSQVDAGMGCCTDTLTAAASAHLEPWLSALEARSGAAIVSVSFEIDRRAVARQPIGLPAVTDLAALLRPAAALVPDRYRSPDGSLPVEIHWLRDTFTMANSLEAIAERLGSLEPQARAWARTHLDPVQSLTMMVLQMSLGAPSAHERAQSARSAA